jgi:ABC-type Fe3+/spermidine/putrescine transport system ATPase subunit
VLIEFCNVSKSFVNTRAISDVSFKIERYEFVALLGPSGSGKTTILRLIAGLESPDKGEIILNNEIVSSRDRYVPPNKRHLGLIFQNLALWPHMTVKQGMEFCMDGNRMTKDKRDEKIIEYLSVVNLNNHMNRYPHQLSGGEKQRFAIVRTLCYEPDILLLDEPLTNLDPMIKKEILNMVIRLIDDLKITAMYVTHDYKEVIKNADRIFFINEGRLIQTGTYEELKNRPVIPLIDRFIED